MRNTTLKAILFGGAIAGVLDITDAIVMTLVAGGSPGRMLQYIASGLLGPSSFDGGTATMMLGLLCHFTIAFGAATVYVLASGRLPVLLERPIVCGLLFGIAVHLVMQNVIVPTSLVRVRTTSAPWWSIANQYLIHMLGVGLPIALAARRWLLGEPDAQPATGMARGVLS